ncbi:hypothetical protein ACIBEF_00660 [Micromonospora sp. NPDC050795]|uniref:hypothetical protein n=1 Tax=Micromonospora sp. NPDC050795 TaxID=3364282 RepID=UPI0037ADA97B
MSYDLRDGTVHAWAPTNTKYVGRHRWNRGGPINEHGRRVVATPVKTIHLLTPATLQLVTRTREQVHADVDQDTGLLAPRDITPTNQWTQPVGVATDDEIQRWAAGGAHIADQTTEGADQ